MDKPKIIEGENYYDDRGCLNFINNFNFNNVKRFYEVSNHTRNFIRAWHGHRQEEKFVYVSKGSALVGAVRFVNPTLSDDPSQCPDFEVPYKFTLTEHRPAILHIPAGFANGFKTLTDDCKIIFFSSSSIDEAKKDDIRFKWDRWNIWQEDFR